MKFRQTLNLSLTLAAASLSIYGHDIHELAGIDVKGRGVPLVGEAVSASQGVVGRIDLETRPILRAGEALEAVPGMIATQHSGSGKANQYFLRGFNLDHGTDFATWLDGMPLNFVTHGHGQGYTDLNFLIPETIEAIEYAKGSYRVFDGDFSAAGSARIKLADTFEYGRAKASIGEHDNFRFLLADAQSVGEGKLVYALERETNDGPWDLPEDLDKSNGMIRFVQEGTYRNTSLTLMGYQSVWNSTDQIPERAIDSGLITDLGHIDDTVGGTSSRYSLSARHIHDNGDSIIRVSAYLVYYDMDLWSNFTYFLEDPINGDQFEQTDRRLTHGLTASQTLNARTLFDKEIEQTYGVDIRYDAIDQVGLHYTFERERIGTTRQDQVDQLGAGAFYEAHVQWYPRLKTVAGLRGDFVHADVDSQLAANSGSVDDFMANPKLTAIYTPNESSELYASGGYGFHSNDARGATQHIDPIDGSPSEAVDPLVRSTGYELGIRKEWSRMANTSISAWQLDLDSELVYVGDAGSTEASRPSSRKGIEIASYFAPQEWLTFDFDLAFTDARYTDADPAGNEIPGALNRVSSAGANVNLPSGWLGTLRYRHFGERPLIEDNTVRSDAFHSFNLRIGYRAECWQASIDWINLFDSDDADIAYAYESRLPGEADEGIFDRHSHRIPPRVLKLHLSVLF